MADEKPEKVFDQDFPALVDEINAIHHRASEEHYSVSLRPSDLAHDCPRFLWLQWRWASKPQRVPGRIQRIFKRGNREEDRLIDDMREAGIVVSNRSQDGRQWELKSTYGHVKGYIDGAANDEHGRFFHAGWRLLEAKSLKASRFRAVIKHGFAKAERLYYGQVQLCMKLAGLTELPAVVAIRNKDTEEDLYLSLPFNATEAERIEARADLLVRNPDAPNKVSVDPTFYLCKMCNQRDVCHGIEMPERNCRSCMHVTPIEDGKWWCNKHNRELTTNQQKAGCADQRYNKSLIHGTVEVYDPALNATQYLLASGAPYTDEGQ